MKKIKIITFILIVILVTMVAFLGVYVHTQNRMEDKVKEYSYAMDLEGARVIRLKLDEGTETVIKDSEGNEVTDAEDLTDEQLAENGYTKEEQPYNSEDLLNKENYEESKNIIQKRLKELNVDNYVIKLDETNGDIVIELTDNDDTDFVISSLTSMGKFEIVDSQTQEVLMDNSDIKKADVMYGAGSATGTGGTAIYLSIEFTKDGAKKLEEISTNYATKEEDSDNTTADENTTTDENATTDDTSTEEETEETKEIIMKIDDEEIMTTSFDEPLRTGLLQLTVGQTSSDEKTLTENVQRASGMAVVLDCGNMPLKYSLEGNEYIFSDITDEQLQIVEYVVLAIIAIALIVLIIRFKTLGILGVFSYVGLASLFLLVIRYANVILSIEGLFGIGLVLILNYIFINSLLSRINKQKDEKIAEISKETNKRFFIRIIPICITVIAFSFINWVPISSFGMVMFWGILLMAIYNIIITKNILSIKTER